MEELAATYVTEVCSLPFQATPTHQQPPVVSALVVLRTCTPLIAGEELNMLKPLSLRQQQPSILNSRSNGKLQPAMLPSVSVSRNHSAFRSLHSAQALLSRLQAQLATRKKRQLVKAPGSLALHVLSRVKQHLLGGCSETYH